MLRLWLRNRRSKGARRSPRILHKRAWWPQVDLCYLFDLLTQWEGTSEKPCGEQTLPKCLRVSLQDLFQDLLYQERPGGPHIREAQKSSPVAQICKERNEQWNRIFLKTLCHHFRSPIESIKKLKPLFQTIKTCKTLRSCTSLLARAPRCQGLTPAQYAKTSRLPDAAWSETMSSRSTSEACSATTAISVTRISRGETHWQSTTAPFIQPDQRLFQHKSMWFLPSRKFRICFEKDLSSSQNWSSHD